MTDFNNDISKNKWYVSRGKITQKTIKSWGIKKHIKVDDMKKSFDRTNGKEYKTGNPYNEKQQRRTKYVHVYDLFDKFSEMYGRDKLK